MNPHSKTENLVIRACASAHKPVLGPSTRNLTTACKTARRVLQRQLPLVLVLALSACSSSPPATLGVHAGRFEPCPSSPNCVNSQATDSEHKIAALALNGDPAETQALLLQVMAKQPGTTLTKAKDNYLRFEVTSAVLRFVDDVEFLVGRDQVEVRSASRLGQSDMGVNRQRIETIRTALAARQP